jgi:hypothetical protein
VSSWPGGGAGLAAGFGFGLVPVPARDLVVGLVVGLVDVPLLEAFGGVAGVPFPPLRMPHNSLPSLHSSTLVTAPPVSADTGPVPAAKNTRAPADKVADAAPTRLRSRLSAIALSFDGFY